jgi:hypothetical protein
MNGQAEETGGFLTGVAILVVLVVIGFVACLAATDEDDEQTMMWTRDQQEEPCHGEDSCKGDCAETESGGYCSDDDLSPSFEDSPVRDSFNFGPVCVLPDSCHFNEPPKEGSA